MSQTFLTDNPPMILDATCSDKKIWPRIATVRIDVQRGVHPDIQASACFLPFRTGLFDIIFCDPPHIIDSKGWGSPPIVGKYFASINRKRYAHSSFMHTMGRFGYWKSTSEWLKFLVQTNKEFRRCLKNEGVLQYKLCEAAKHRSVKLKQILVLLTNWVLIKKEETKSRNGNNVYWLTMKPKVGSTTT